MDFQDIIIKKRDKQKLTKEEISFFFRNFFSFLSYYICLFNTSFHLGFDSKHHLYLIIKSFKSANYSIYYFFPIYMITYF